MKIIFHKQITVFFLLAVMIGNIYSQSSNNKYPGIIIGNVIGDEGKALANVTVSVFLLSDTPSYKTVLTDKNGAFELDALPFGLYRLRISALGYLILNIDSIHIRAERYDFNMGDMKLNASLNKLEDVIVYSEKPLIENGDGKITYNVGESVLSAGASTSEILKNMPLISNDPNGKLLLKGKEPKILIDDKPVELNAQQLNDLLESLPGGSIERIELMVTPPQQYATEQGGVINIVTKKGRIGWTGKIGWSVDTRGEGNFSGNISYRNRKFSFISNAGFGINRLRGNSYSKRQNFYTDSTNYFNTKGNYLNKNLRPNLRLQVDYEIDKQNIVSAVYQGNLNYFDNTALNQYQHINRFQEPYRFSIRNNSSQGIGYSQNFNITYTRKGKDAAEVLRIIAVGSYGKNGNDRDFFQQVYYVNVLDGDSLQQQLIDNTSNAYSLRMSYDKPLKKQGTSLSIGAYASHNNYHNSLLTNFFSTQGNKWLENNLLSTDFRFGQTIVTLRSGFNYNINNSWKLIAGLQAEYTAFDFNFVKGNAANVDHNYWNILPNITIRKDITKEIKTALVYRASIKRPGIGELNPGIDYSDPYNIRYGNPFLAASLADNFDWNISWSKGKYYINTSLGYNSVRDVFNTVRTLISGGVTEITWQNINDRKEYEVSVWGGYTINKKLRMNASVGYTYNEYGEQEKLLYKYRDGGSFYTSLNCNYMVSPVLNFEGNTRYSSFADPQGRSRSNVAMNIGVQHKFFQKRLSVNLHIIDPFRKQSFLNYTYGANFFVESYHATNTKNVRLSVSYQLNKTVVNSKRNLQKAELINMFKKGS